MNLYNISGINARFPKEQEDDIFAVLTGVSLDMQRSGVSLTASEYAALDDTCRDAWNAASRLLESEKSRSLLAALSLALGNMQLTYTLAAEDDPELAKEVRKAARMNQIRAKAKGGVVRAETEAGKNLIKTFLENEEQCQLP